MREGAADGAIVGVAEGVIVAHTGRVITYPPPLSNPKSAPRITSLTPSPLMSPTLATTMPAPEITTRSLGVIVAMLLEAGFVLLP